MDLKGRILMNKEELKELLNKVQTGEKSVDEAILELRLGPIQDIDIAQLDMHRGLRQGIGEVIYGAGKTPEQIDRIAHAMWEAGQKMILVTRMSQKAADHFTKDIPFEYFEEARIAVVGQMIEKDAPGYVLVITAGTSDIPVAEEAAVTAEALGNEVHRVYDAGVAGIHRLLKHTDDILNARVIIAIAGMEGALASVVGGLADSVAEYLHGVRIVSSDGSAAAEAVNHAYLVKQVVGYLDILANSLHVLWELLMVIPGSVANVDVLRVTDGDTAGSDIGDEIAGNAGICYII